MELQFEDHDGICLIRAPEKELGADLSDQLRVQLLAKLEEQPFCAVDLTAVEFMDSSALGALVAGVKCVRDRGHMRLFGLQPSIENLFRLTGMGRVFPTDVDESSAIASVRDAMDKAA